GRARFDRRPHNCLEMAPALWSGAAPSAARSIAIQAHDRGYEETYVRVAGRGMYLFRAVDSRGETVDFYLSERRDRESAKAFLEKALSNPENQPPWVLCMDKSPIYPAAIRELKAEGRLDEHCRLRR